MRAVEIENLPEYSKKQMQLNYVTDTLLLKFLS